MDTISEAMQSEIKWQKSRAVFALESIMSRAQAALHILEVADSITYTHSEINGIGNDYDEIIRVIEKLNTVQQLHNFYEANTTPTK